MSYIAVCQYVLFNLLRRKVVMTVGVTNQKVTRVALQRRMRRIVTLRMNHQKF